MKKYFSYLLAIVLCFSLGVAADDKPAAKKPFILLNNNTVIPDGTATNGQYSQFAAACRDAGFDIDHRWLLGVTDQDLEGVDIFILTMPAFTLMSDDKAAIRRFVKNGGGLFVAAYPNFQDTSNLDSLITNYGITIGTIGQGAFSATVPTDSPLRKPNSCSKIGSTSMYSASYYLVLTKNAESAGTLESGDILAAISKHKNIGKGRVAVIGSAAFFNNNLIGMRDNRNFGVNMMHYLVGRGGWDLKALKSKFKGSSSRSAGDQLTVIGKVKNISSAASEATKLRFLLSDSNTYPIGPAADTVTLKTVTLPSINANKSKKVKETVKIPNWIMPGDYYLLIVIDPEGKSDDSNEDNNYKASKKRLSIE